MILDIVGWSLVVLCCVVIPFVFLVVLKRRYTKRKSELERHRQGLQRAIDDIKQRTETDQN